MAGTTFASGCTPGFPTSWESATPSRGAYLTLVRSWTLARDEKWTSTGTFWTSAGNSARASCSEHATNAFELRARQTRTATQRAGFSLGDQRNRIDDNPESGAACVLTRNFEPE